MTTMQLAEAKAIECLVVPITDGDQGHLGYARRWTACQEWRRWVATLSEWDRKVALSVYEIIHRP